MKKKKQECLDLKKTRLVSQVLVQFTVILGVFLINSSCSALKLNSKKSQPQPDYGGYGDAEAKPLLSLYADCSEIQAGRRAFLGWPPLTRACFDVFNLSRYFEYLRRQIRACIRLYTESCPNHASTVAVLPKRACN